MVAATGGTPLKLNDTLGVNEFVVDFKWSPDGTKLAFRAGLVNGFDLFVVNADGSNLRVINAALPAFSGVAGYHWSPDGTQLLYEADRVTDGQNLLYVVNVGSGIGDEGPVSGTLVAGSTISSSAWSPSGDWVLYIADAEVLGQDELFAVRTDGSNLTKLSGTMVASGDVHGAKWSPNGSQVAFVADRATSGVDELWISTPDAPTPQKFSGALAANGDVSRTQFAFSPDGASIAYLADAVSNDDFQLFVTATSTAAPTELAESVAFDSLESLAWSPLGGEIAFVGFNDESGTNVRRLGVVTVASDAAELVSGNFVAGGSLLNGPNGYAWSPEGVSLAFLADKRTDEVIEPFAVDVAFDFGAEPVLNSLIAGGDAQRIFWAPISLQLVGVN